MPVTYTIDVAARTVFVSAVDPLTDEDLLAGQAALRADPFFHPDFRQLFDLRQVTAVNRISSNVLRALAAHSAFGPPARRALVVSPEPSAYGLARMFGALVDGKGGEVMVFRDLGDARRWLGLDE